MKDLSAVAHDLGTPLTAMLGHIQLLSAENLSEAGRRRLEIMEAQVRRMSRLIETQLAPRPAQLEFGRRLVDLRSMLQRAIGELDILFRRSGIRVSVVSAVRLPLVPGDADALHRVAVNIFKNAVDAMPGGGRVQVTLRDVHPPTASAPSVAIDVADTGSGIPRDLQQRIFEPRFTTKAPGQGAGLGLTICRQIVEAHGGRIELSSEIGQGTSVRLVLPQHACRAAARLAPEAVPELGAA